MTDDGSTRRRFLSVASAGGVTLLTGCAGLDRAGTAHRGSNSSRTATAGGSATHTPTETAGQATEEPTDTPGETSDEGDAETDEGPGYKSDHWHGRLFLEVNGELVDFRQPKYYLKNVEDDNPEAVYFHFHEEPDSHGPNEWSNEKQIVTFARALDLLPGIEYEQPSGAHVLTYDGTQYDARDPGTSISIHEGTERIDPTSHEVRHDDTFWVQVTSEDPKRTVSPAHEGADLGTLVFDVNNHRVDFGRRKYLEGGSEAFHFHDDGHPSLWYLEGTVSLQAALNSLPGIHYERSGGNHVVEYHDDDHASHSRTFDGGSSHHEIIVRQRTTGVDPTDYQLRAGDIVWIYVHSDLVPDNEH